MHPQTAVFLELLASWGPADAGAPPEPESLRELVALRGPSPGPAGGLHEVTDETVAGVPVRVYRPAPGELPAIVYFHGGGWVIGSIDSVDDLCRSLAAESGCAVLNVGYRLAPEDPFPAAVEDAWAVTALAALAYPRVAVAGDSAGGNLAAVTALRARDEGVRLAHQLLVYPATDTGLDTPSYRAYDGYGLTAWSMAWFLGLYAGPADRSDPRLAPLRARSLAGTAPATVITAECDILRDEGEAYAARLRAEGVPAELRRYDGMVHSFFLLPEIFDAAGEALTFAAARLRAALLPDGGGPGP